MVRTSIEGGPPSYPLLIGAIMASWKPRTVSRMGNMPPRCGLTRGMNSSPAAVSRADVEVARYPASAWDDGPFGRPAAVGAHVTDLEAKLYEKT